MGAAVAVCGLTCTGLVATSAQSAEDPSCPPAAPRSSLERGEQVHGLTVSSGVRPDRFTGEYVGRIKDGIAPGIPMLMVKLSGSVITDADGDVDRGIWAGMSGSPVYDSDGNLIGAVAYGLSWSPSDYAGVTPAGVMYKVAAGDDTAPARTVAVPHALGRQMVAEGDASRAQVEGGFERLPMPVGVSGISSKRLDRFTKRTDVKPDRVVGGAGGASTSERATPIIPGGNLTASLSYGDVTAAGIGTVTAVCGAEVLGFGHPMLFSGRSEMTMHGARALYVQRDTVFGSFKVANPTAPVGQVVQDRLAAILGVEGARPDTATITSTVRSEGRFRRGTTFATMWKPYLSAVHMLFNIDRVFDQIGQGTASVRWTVDIEREDGSVLIYDRADRIGSTWDVSSEVGWNLWEDLDTIEGNRFEDVDIADVDGRIEVTPRLDALNIRRLEYRANGEWVEPGRRDVARARAGSTLRLRVLLAPHRDSELDSRWQRFALDLPRRAAGMRGSVVVRGGASIWWYRPKASNLEGLIEALETAPRQDEVQVTLRLKQRREAPVAKSETKRNPGVVSGWEYLRVAVRR